jgi:hypothetical protein
MESSNDSNKSFFKHVFNLDNDSKSDILNIIQYALLSIIPVVILNKLMQKYVPEADDKKGSLEISAEILIQIIIMFIGLLIIHRIITYIPRYSGMDYPEFNIIYIILAVLMIILSLQTKIGEKVSILVDRILELWNGQTEKKTNKGKQGTVKVSQPISGQIIQSPTVGQNAMSQSLYGTSAINSLPTNDMTNNTQSNQYTMSPQQLPNYNNMYQEDNTPLVGAASPTQENFMEPMAANSVLGGSAFGSW